MNDFKTLIEKYGLTVVLMIVVGIIGLALYLWKKEEDTKEAKTIATAGVAVAITGLFIGLASIGYQIATTAKNTTGGNGGNGTVPPPNGGDDTLPPGE